MSRVRITTIFFLVSVFCLGGFWAGGDFASAEMVDHIMISEIQFTGSTANDEFIKLYNPTDEDIDLYQKQYSIQYLRENYNKSKKRNFNEGNIILSHGSFLIANENWEGDTTPDLVNKSFNLTDESGTVYLVKSKNYIKENGGEINYNDVVDYISYANSSAEENLEEKENQENKEEEIEEEGIDENDDGGEPTPNPSQERNSGGDNFDIIITELVPNPEDSDAENEFIEIYNQGNTTANISGWTMEDKLGKTSVFAFPENTILSSKEYRVFYRPETKITLNNSGDGVILKNSNGKIVSETPASSAAMEDWSWLLDKDGEWEWSLTPTAGAENIFETEEEPPLTPPSQGGEKEEIPSQGGEKKKDFDYSDEIMISEIFPNPEGRDNQDGNYEWVELYNSSDQKINLYGWQIDDLIGGGSRPYFIESDLEILAHSYLTLDYSRTKIVLNNNGDEVNLINPDGKIIDKAVYGKGGKEGWSYARDENNLSEIKWDWSDSPTRGKNNIGYRILDIEEEDEKEIGNGKLETGEEYSENNPQEISITEAKGLARYSWVKIKGVVSAPTGVFGGKTVYLSGSGIQIYLHKENLPNLKTGDIVEAIGRVSEIGGEKRILLSQADDLKVIGYQKEPEPLIILTGEAGEPIEGYLVTVEGKVTQTSGDVFYLDDGSGEVKIYIKSSTGIKKPKMKKGDWMVVTGQVSRTSAGYRILPRFQDDIRLGRVSGISANLAEAGSSPLLVILILIGGLVLGDWGRIKLNRITN